MNTQEEMTKAIKHAGKFMKKEQDRIMPPDEYCPECLSLKRKPNKDCLNHGKTWTGNELGQTIDELARLMVEKIANNIIEVDTTSEGRSAQRHWYLVAQKMLKKLMAEYKRVCKEEYHG